MNRNSPWYVLGYMAALCVVFGTGVSLVHYATRNRLAANERLNHNRVVCDAFNLPVDGRAPADYARAMTNALEIAQAGETGATRDVYRYRVGQTTRYGYPFSGMGFWDRIDGFVTLSDDLRTIQRLRFFDHKETPGLGARIEEPDFLDQFEGLAIDWEAAPSRRVLIGAGLNRDQPNRVDAVTGATQTSSALMDFLNAELERIRAIDLEALTFQPIEPMERR